MTVDEIKEAVKSGRRVYWKNFAYRVICDSIGQWLVKYEPTGYCWGLTNMSGVLSGQGEDFFIHDSQTITV